MKDSSSLKNNVLTSLAWLGGLKYIGQIASWVMTLIVIRILQPSDLGLMALASICVNFLVVISELGLGAAIIQKKDLNDRQLSQVFGFVILSHFVLALSLHFSAVLISGFFSEPRLVPILQVLSFNFLLLALYIIPRSILIREMEFKKKALSDLVATILSSGVSLFFAFNGYGVWSLVWASVSIHFLYLVGYTLSCRKFFVPRFHFGEISEFISFGAHTLFSRILWFFYSKADVAIGGRLLGNELLGIYSVAQELAAIPLSKFMPIITEVAFPAYSSIQSNIRLVGSHFLKTGRLGSIILFPVFWGFYSVAPEAVSVLLGEKWETAAFPLQLVCLIMPLRALGSLISPMLLGIGRVDINLLNTVIAAVILPAAFWVGTYYGAIPGLCMGWIFGYGIVFLVMAKLSLRVLQLRLSDFLSNILIAPLASVAMVLAVRGSRNFVFVGIPDLWALFLMVPFGVVVYSLLIRFYSPQSVDEVFSMLPQNSRMVQRIRVVFGM